MTVDTISRVLRELDFRAEPLQVEENELVASNHFCFELSASGSVVGLNLSNLGLEHIPESVRALAGLKTLRIHGNHLQEVPGWISELRHLRRLYLPKNEFSAFPLPVLDCANLEVLALNQNHLDHVPEGVSRLARLRKLGLGGNRLSELPSALTAIPTIECVYVAGNSITELPDWISGMSTLRELDLARNPLKVLPPEFGNLRALRWLSLRQTEMTDFPDCILHLAGIEHLDFNGAQIEVLPAGISQIACSLRHLHMAGTRIRDLPADFDQLSNLETLNLSGLRLYSAPQVIFSAARLRELNLSATRLSELPDEIGDLLELTTLDLSGTGLKSLPNTVFTLPKLQWVNLAGNRLRKLPVNITKCALPIFWYAPRAAVNTGILLHGNPLESPPPEIVLKGTTAVHAYFRSLEGGRKSVDEVKILLVGDGGAGKTSLLKRLLGRGHDPGEPQTHGINIDETQFVSGGKHVKVHFWDFGGQEIMHATHQFFLSKRSLYILVLDGRKEEKVEYWLKHIDSFGGDSPIFVVVNKTDQYPTFDVNRRFLSDKYPGIREYFRVSCSAGSGVDAIRKALSTYLARIEHTNMMWASNWFNVKERLEQMTSNYIGYDEFRTICDAEHIQDDQAQETLLEFLHDLGIVLHFHDLALRDTNVINPRWITEGVYRIVTSAHVIEGGGVLNVTRLPEILDRRSHPPEKHHFIIELLKKFELCYELAKGVVLLPGLLPIEEPRLRFPSADSVRFVIDYDFLPRSIIPRFIVRMHADIEDNHRWRTGVVLYNAVLEARALIRSDEEERRIDILVYGDQRRDYLSVLLHAFREINTSFERISPVEKVPMPDAPAITVSYSHLLRLEVKGVITYLPDGSDREYVVQELLGHVQPRKRTEDEILAILRKLKNRSDDEESLLAKANSSLILQPNVFGLGVNLNELIRRVFRRD